MIAWYKEIKAYSACISDIGMKPAFLNLFYWKLSINTEVFISDSTYFLLHLPQIWVVSDTYPLTIENLSQVFQY